MAFLRFPSILLCALLSASEPMALKGMALPALFPCPGGARWESLALDSGARRIYVPGATSILVMDLEGRALGAVPHVLGARAVGVAPELGIGFTSNGRSNTVSVFNLETLEVEKELRTTGAQPNAILFEPATRRIFAFNEGGRNATAFDAFGGAVAGSIPLGGRPGSAVADGAGRLYVSVAAGGEGQGEIQVLDARRLAVLHRWPLGRMEGPVGMALDPARERLFVLGRNAWLGILDTRSGALVSSLVVGAAVAGVICDAVTGRAYVSSGEGELTVVEPVGAERYALGARIAIRSGVRAPVLDQQSRLPCLPSLGDPLAFKFYN